MRDIHDMFQVHGRLLLLLYKLEVISGPQCSLTIRDFQQNTWAQIRDGEL